MDPKFQSSFIPKGPIASTAPNSPVGRTVKERSLLSFVAVIIFSVSVILALGVFGYKYYLRYRIDKMGTDLEAARAALEPETIRELVRLDDRIISTADLVSRHQVLTPLFEFLEVSTPRTVRFNDFRYTMTEEGLELSMRGEARGYAVLALQADIFNKSAHFIDPIFSDLNLNERGDVSFSFNAIVNPDLVSYARLVEGGNVPVPQPVVTPVPPVVTLPIVPVATSTATSSPRATSTPN